MLSEVFCIIDTREQNKARINAVTEFIESHGGAVEHSKLDLCDYKLEGIFREKEICIGIEAKSLSDFSGSYQDLPDKLSRSFELYNDVALFVEIPQIRTSSSDGFHATIINQSVPDGSADVLQYAVLQNSLASWQSEGVHVRQLQNEAFWGYAMASVLISITKDTHRGLEITKVKDFRSQYLNILSKFDGIGQKTALKVIKNFPNLYWLCTYSEDDLKDAIGKVTGTKLYQFIHNNDLITSEWANKGSKTQISKETEKSLKSNPEQSTEVKNNTVTELTAQNNKLIQPNTEINPELKYLDENKGKCIEVPKGKYQNGGQLFDVVDTKLKQEVLNLIKQNPKGIEYKKACDVFVVQGYTEDNFYQATKSLMQDDGEIYEPKLGLLVATNPLQSSSAVTVGSHTITSSSDIPVTGTLDTLQLSNTGKPETQSAGCETQMKKESSDNPASQTLAGAGSRSSDDSKGKADELVSLAGGCHKSGLLNGASPESQLKSHRPSEREPIDKPHCSRSASSDDKLPEAPDNSEFKANPRLRNIVEFIRQHPRTLDDVGKEFGLSQKACMDALYYLKDEKKRIWFNKSTLCFEFGCDKNPVPVVADKEFEVM